MKVLRITAKGLPLFKKELDICFYTQQRVSEDDKENLYNFLDDYSVAPEAPVRNFEQQLSDKNSSALR